MSTEPLAPPARVAARLARVVEVALSRIELSPAQYRTLMVLGDGAARASTMADHLSVSRPTVTAVVDGLVARGLVDRRHDEQDRRRVGHSITSEGRKLLERADVTLEAALDEILGHAEDESDRHSAIDGLISWQRALDRYRSARHAEKSQRAASPSEAVMS